MDRRVIADKLERLRRCVQRIEHKRPPTLHSIYPPTMSRVSGPDSHCRLTE
jgi:hypothetical protein